MANRTRKRNKTIQLGRDQLIFRFPNVHEDAELRIEFQRTLRIPDDNRSYRLPPGLGKFPLYRVDDYPDNLPNAWKEHGGVFLPMYQTEAMWIRFHTPYPRYPMAVKIAAGKINAVTGAGWKDELTKTPQDYLVVPEQPWLDGFCVEKGLIRQFVAMPLGEGYTAEEQLTGEAEHGGLQIAVYPMQASIYEAWRSEQVRDLRDSPGILMDVASEIGLAPGGLMHQEIYEDEYGFDAWDRSIHSRCYVHIVNSVQLVHLTGCEPPSKPRTAQDYTAAGLPWFDYYGDDLSALEGAKKLAGLDSVAVAKLKTGRGFLKDNDPVTPVVVKKLNKLMVREGTF